MLSLFWAKHRSAIFVGLGALLLGFSSGFYIQLKIKEAAFFKLEQQAHEVQTNLQDKADLAIAAYGQLTGQLEEANNEISGLRVTLSSVESGVRNSGSQLTSRIKAAPTSCVKGESVAALIRTYTECTSLVRESNTALSKCAKDAGQCGIDRKALLDAWPTLESAGVK